MQQRNANTAQMKFVTAALHKLLDKLLLTCYSDDINDNNMELVDDTLERVKDMCCSLDVDLTVQDCIDYLQNWRSDLQNLMMLVILQEMSNTTDAEEAVLQLQFA